MNADDWVYVPVAVRKTYPALKSKRKMRRRELEPFLRALNERLTWKWRGGE